MSFLQANLLCVVLVAIDLIARTWRLQWILRGLHFRVPFSEVFTLNVVGDAASAFTPLRVGGDPTRLAALTHARVPVAAGVVAILIEIAVMWPVIIAAAGWLALIYAPAWWRGAEPHIERTLATAWPWVAAIVAASVMAWWLMRRVAPHASLVMRRGTRRAMAYWRRMPAWPLVASIPLTLVGLAARVAILPVLAMTLSSPPPMGPLSFASFLLIYGQLVLPTPSGMGVVELGFLGGAVGDLGASHRAILLIWRMYTTFVFVALGVLLGIPRYGRVAVGAMLRGRGLGVHRGPDREP